MNKTRPNRVFFRVTDEELKFLNQRVKESGMTRQDWLLQAIKTFIKGGGTSQKEVGTPYWNTIDIIKNNKGMDMDPKKLNVYGRTIGEEVLSKYK